MSDPVVIKLKSPITFGSRTVEQLTIRAPKAKDLRRVNQSASPMQTSLDMASWLTGELKEVIDELEGDDLRDVLKVVDDFFTRLRGTGPTSSES
jgi:hypothetical protein